MTPAGVATLTVPGSNPSAITSLVLVLELLAGASGAVAAGPSTSAASGSAGASTLLHTKHGWLPVRHS